MGREGRRGGRAARRAHREPTRWLAPVRRSFAPLELLSEGELARLHEGSLALLERVGIAFRRESALARWARAGARVEGDRVRIPRELLMELVGQAPSRFWLRARNPERDVEIGGETTVFLPNYGSPFVRMFDGERRYGTLADLEVFHKLAQLAPALHGVGSVICEPTDLPVPQRHLRITESALVHGDKVVMGPVTAPERARDALRMMEIVFGAERVAREAVILALINCNSPLVWDATMLGALEVYAEAGQPTIVSPFALAGANTPASVPAALVQLNAEALAGIAYVQLCRPGCPVIYGHFLSAVSMKSGAPMAGTSELALMNLAIGQLARSYGIPWRSSGMLTGAKRLDAQAGYESAFNMLPILFAGAHVVLHCAGWSEAGLVANLAKFLIDAEQMAMLHRLAGGMRFDDFSEALAAIEEVGPGGHFFGTRHTQAHFRDAFFMAELFDHDSYEQWREGGERDAGERALAAARELLAGYRPPFMEDGVREELGRFVAERLEEVARDQDGE